MDTDKKLIFKEVCESLTRYSKWPLLSLYACSYILGPLKVIWTKKYNRYLMGFVCVPQENIKKTRVLTCHSLHSIRAPTSDLHKVIKTDIEGVFEGSPKII